MITPIVVRVANTSSKVVFPAPETPCRSLEWPERESKNAYHQGCQCTGLHPTINVIQNPAVFALDLDIVTDVFPMENGRLSLNDGGNIDASASFLQSSYRAGCIFLVT